MDDLRYQIDMLTAMNKTYVANEKIYKIICEASNKVFIYFSPESGLLKTFGHWNDYYDFILNDYSDLLRALDLVDEEYRERVRDAFFLEKTGKSSDSTLILLRDKKTYLKLDANIYYDGAGKVREKLLTFTDVSKEEKLKKDLSYMAYYDLMTNLFNRNYYVQRLGEFIEKASAEKAVISVLMINIDDFHKINDSMGIIIGDEVIQAFGLFLNSLTDNDSIIGARFDGDIYSLAIFDPVGTKSVESVYEEIKEFLKDPIKLTNGSEVTLTVSIGVAEYPEAADMALELCNCAEVVMVRVKENGKNNIGYYDSKVLEEFKEAVNFENKLKDAVKEGAFHLNYQPQYYSDTNELRGVEALIRWKDETGKFISPAAFIPIAERIGVIVPLGDWVLEESIRTYMDWKLRYGIDMILSVNISSIQFRQHDFVNKIINTLYKYDMNPEDLEIELTESVLIDEYYNVCEKMEELRDFGIRISIDDFGTGYSSLSYLKKLPADTIKIDKSFIDTLNNDRSTGIIVSSIINMSQDLGFKTVAEGVETDEQLRALKDMSCDLIQGYFLGRPIDKEAMDELLLRMI